MTHDKWTRRAMMSGMGVGAVALAGAGAGAAQAQAPAGGFRSTRHPQDAWIDGLPGMHRTIIDSTSARGVGEAVLFARNLYVGNAAGYGLKDADVAIIVCLRHAATIFAFNDAMWAKYGARFAEREQFMDPATKQAPTANLYNRAGYSRGGTLDSLAARGTHFAVCSVATQGLAGQIASATGVTAEAAFTELTSNLAPNSHMVPAGVVGVTRAQEYGYALLNAG